MIKVETLGMLEIAKNNPTITSQSAVANYSFLTVDGDVYLISNTITGDDAYKKDVTIPAGEYLNGFLVKNWESQNLIIDETHIDYAANKSYADIVAGTTILTIKANGNVEIANAAPESGVYFKVVEKTTLTGKAVKAKVYVA